MPAFTVETRKDYNGYTWANTWHMWAESFLTAQNGAQAITAFERQLLASQATMVGHKLSTWPNPTNQQFTITSWNLPGERVITNLQPAEMCMLLSIHADTGHPGKKWLRCSLDEGDITSVAGKAVIPSGAAVRTLYNTTGLALQDELDSAGVYLIVGAHWSNARSTSNYVTLKGAGFRDMDVGWYNKNTTP